MRPPAFLKFLGHCGSVRGNLQTLIHLLGLKRSLSRHLPGRFGSIGDVALGVEVESLPRHACLWRGTTSRGELLRTRDIHIHIHVHVHVHALIWSPVHSIHARLVIRPFNTHAHIRAHLSFFSHLFIIPLSYAAPHHLTTNVCMYACVHHDYIRELCLSTRARIVYPHVCKCE